LWWHCFWFKQQNFIQRLRTIHRLPHYSCTVIMNSLILTCYIKFCAGYPGWKVTFLFSFSYKIYWSVLAYLLSINWWANTIHIIIDFVENLKRCCNLLVQPFSYKRIKNTSTLPNGCADRGFTFYVEITKFCGGKLHRLKYTYVFIYLFFNPTSIYHCGVTKKNDFKLVVLKGRLSAVAELYVN